MDRYAGLAREVVAEMLGTTLLLTTIVGSGVMAERLAAGNMALTLLGNTLATGAMLSVLILSFGAISGAHFNPLVSVVLSLRRQLPLRKLLPYASAQLAGALLGVMVAHAMFDLPLLGSSATQRVGAAQAFSELVATFGLVGTILAVSRARPMAVPYAVGLYITAAYWFTASTSFANPAVTVARALTPTFSGIALGGVPVFVAAQICGGLLAAWVFAWLLGDARDSDRSARLAPPADEAEKSGEPRQQ